METWINRQGDDMIGLIDWLIDWLNGKCMMMMGEQSDGWMDGQINTWIDTDSMPYVHLTEMMLKKYQTTNDR